jgi:tetratricopeptide (TPR) repeat protein
MNSRRLASLKRFVYYLVNRPQLGSSDSRIVNNFLVLNMLRDKMILRLSLAVFVWLVLHSGYTFSQERKDESASTATAKTSEGAGKQAGQSPSSAEGTAPTASQAPLDPIVARIDMTLKLKDEVIGTIGKGDLLTVVTEREKDFVILTLNGKKGAVAKSNAVKLSESLPIYEELILQAPEDGRLYTLRASAHWAMGDAKKALADYDKAIDLGYDSPHAYASRGLFLSAMGESDKAIADFSKAIKADPKDEVSFMNRASVYMAIGQYAKATEDYSAALDVRKENPVLYSQRAVSYKLQGKLEEALKDYDRAIELVEKDISAWMGRGFIKFQLGRFQSAVDDFSKVIELAPQSAVAFNNRGFNHQQLKEYDKALADYQRAVELAPRYVLALQNRAWLLTICEQEELRDPASAVEIAKIVNEITEFKDINDLTLLGATFAAAGDYETAVGWQEKVVAIANAEQKPVAGKILALYQDKKPIDPGLLEQSQADTSSQSPASAATNSQVPKSATEKATDK